MTQVFCGGGVAALAIGLAVQWALVPGEEFKKHPFAVTAMLVTAEVFAGLAAVLLTLGLKSL